MRLAPEAVAGAGEKREGLWPRSQAVGAIQFDFTENHAGMAGSAVRPGGAHKVVRCRRRAGGGGKHFSRVVCKTERKSRFVQAEHPREKALIGRCIPR